MSCEKVKTVYVVTISEMTSVHSDELDVEVFEKKEAAEAWIEVDIAEKTTTYGLEVSAVDGWYVEPDGPTHTLQYNVMECWLR